MYFKSVSIILLTWKMGGFIQNVLSSKLCIRFRRTPGNYNLLCHIDLFDVNWLKVIVANMFNNMLNEDVNVLTMHLIYLWLTITRHFINLFLSWI